MRTIKSPSGRSIQKIRFTPHSQLFLLDDQGELTLWDLETHELVWQFRASVLMFTLSPDGRMLGTVEGDLTQLWNIASRRLHENRPARDHRHPTALRLLNDYHFIVVRWPFSDEPNGVVALHAPFIPLRGSLFSPDGRWLTVLHGKTIQTIEFAVLRECSLNGRWGNWNSWSIHCPANSLAYSADSRWLVVGVGRSATIIDLDNPTAPVRSLSSHKRTVRGMTFTPDSRYLLTASVDHRVKVWDLETDQERCDFWWRVGKLSDVQMSPDGMLVAAIADDEVVLWDWDG